MRYPEKSAPRLRGWREPGEAPGALAPPPLAPLPTPLSPVSSCFCAESCFLFALTRQKLPPFCQQGYLRTQGLVGTESLRQHGVESGLLRDYATVGRGDSGQQPGDRRPGQHPLAPGPPVSPFDSNKEEL